jgi:hypothetical protein
MPTVCLNIWCGYDARCRKNGRVENSDLAAAVWSMGGLPIDHCWCLGENLYAD